MEEVDLGFYKYLIQIGSRMNDYPYTPQDLIDNIDYFRKCFENDLSAYKALEWLGLYKEGEIDFNESEVK